MAVLEKIAEWALKILGPIFLNFLMEKVNAWRLEKEAKKKAEADNKQVRDQTEAAKTPGERDEALRNELRNS